MAYLSFADRERMFSLISFMSATRGFLEVNLNKLDLLSLIGKKSNEKGLARMDVGQAILNPEVIEHLRKLVFSDGPRKPDNGNRERLPR